MNNKLNNYNKNDIYVLAVSTGVDSMVLLDLAIKNNLNIVVAHVNHNKRESSIKEEAFVKEYCLKNNLKLEILQFNNTGNNFQNEARNARYNFFYNVSVKYNASKIFTAHHSFDNVETVLINILRGSNLKGYAGLGNSSYNGISIERPLLTFSKNEIYKYALDNNITFFEDESNLDNTYLRNNIRNNVVKNIELVNNTFDKKFLQYSNLLNESFDFIRSTSLSYIKDNKVNIKEYNNLHIAIKKDILNCLFEQYNLNTSNSKIDDCIKLLSNNKPNLSYNIQKDYKLIKEYDFFYLSNNSSKEVYVNMGEFDKCEIDMYKTFYFSNKIPKTYTSYIKICYNKEEFPLVIRTRLDGDKINIKNGTKKVSDFFKDLKIPKEQRDNILLVENNKKEIIWILDYYKKKIDEDFIYLVYEEA